MIQSIYKKFRYDSKNTVLSIKITIVSIIIVMAVFGIVHIVYATSVDTKDEKMLSYVSVCINKDDTLWGIADKYFSDEFGSVEKYVQEIKRCNGLKSDAIYSGRYIVVPLYIEQS